MLFKNSVRTSKKTPHLTITKINWLTLFKFNQKKPPSFSQAFTAYHPSIFTPTLSLPERQEA
jgi:hypothetical protein